MARAFQGTSLVKKVVFLLFLACLALFLYYNYRAADMTYVYRAKADIPANTRIAASMLEEVLVPRSARDPGAMEDPSQIVGKWSRSTIYAGQTVVERVLSPTPPGAARGDVTVPPDKLLYALVLRGGAEAIFPYLTAGSLVHVLATGSDRDPEAVILSGVRIHRVSPPATVLLELKPDEVQRLARHEHRQLRVVLTAAEGPSLPVTVR